MAKVPEIDLVNALNNFLVAGIGAIIYAVFKTVLDRTLFKDLKRSDDADSALRAKVESNTESINKIITEMTEIKGRQARLEEIVAIQLKQLQEQYAELKRDMKGDLGEIMRLIKRN